MSEPHEYCLMHDQPLDWCQEPTGCREFMTQVARLMDDNDELLRRLADG